MKPCVVCRKKGGERQTGAGVGDFERGWWGWGEGCSLEGLVWEGILKGGGGGGKACSCVGRHFERGIKACLWEGPFCMMVYYKANNFIITKMDVTIRHAKIKL